MPAAAQFTPTFVEAFVTRCFEEGLSKEAATHMLNLAAQSAAHSNPGFSEGFHERLAAEGFIEKSAWAMAGKLLTGGLALGGLGIGAKTMADRMHNFRRQPWGDVPLAGTYDPAMAQAGEQSKLEMASKGVADLNLNADRDGKRMYELQQVVDSGGPGAAAAIAELQNLRRSPFASQRDRYGRELERYNEGITGHLGMVQDDIRRLNGSRDSFWNRTRSFFGFPRDFDSEERNLVSQQARLAEQARISQRLRQRLQSGATSFSPGVPTSQDLQQRFFPTH